MIALKLYDRNGTTLLGLLPDPISWSVSFEFSDVGALTFDYPASGINANLITELREVALTDSGINEYGNGRFVITGINRDRISSTGTISVTARSILWRLDTALAYPDGGLASGETGRFFDTKTAGFILKTVIDAAQTRGALAGLTYNFTATNDSNSAAWPETTTQEYPARSSILSIIRGLNELGILEVGTLGRALYATKGDGVGTDKTTGANPVVLRYGYNITEAPETTDAGSIAGAVLVEGDKGLLVERTNSTTVSTYGRLETSLTASGIDDTAVVQSLGDTYLGTLTAADRQLTVGLTMQAGTPQPLTDFNVGDYVYTATASGLERVRVRQITISMSDGTVTGSATLGDRLYESDINVARKLRAITSGSVQAGNGTLPTPVVDVVVVPDTVAPSPATSLTGSTAAYVEGVDPRASVSLTWTAPTTNADATALTDLDFYEVQIRTGSTDDWEFEANAYTNSAKISGLTVATSYRFRVIAVDTSGNRSTASNEYVVTSANITSATGLTPGAPTVSTRLGTVSVTWNGLSSTGGAMPADFSYMAVHVSTTNNFTPGAGTYKGRMTGADTLVFSDLAYNTAYYVKFVAYNKSGVASAASTQASATVTPLVNTDLIGQVISSANFQGGSVDTAALASGAVSASKLLDGAVTGTKISADAVTADKIAAGAIGADEVAANAIVAGKIAANAVTAGTIAALAISAGNIQANAITADKIEAGAITTVKLAANAITADKIAAGTITATQISSSYVYAGTIAASNITAGTVSASVAFNAASGTFTGAINATSGYIGSASGWNFSPSGHLTNSASTTILYPSGNTYALITDRAVSANTMQVNSSSSSALSVSGGMILNGTASIAVLEIANTASIVGGYGITTDWAPNTDSGGTLGQSGRRWTRLWATTTTISTSDARLKTAVNDAELGLEFVKSLRPVSYKWIVGDKSYKLDEEGNPISTGVDELGKPIFEMETRPGVRRHFGFLAQEVKQALDASGAEDFAGWVQDDLSDPDSRQSLSYEQFIAPLTKAVQELAARLEQLEARA